MKKAKLNLNLNKETVANLNNTEMNEVKGGTIIKNTGGGRTCQSICLCGPSEGPNCNETEQYNTCMC